MVAGGPPLTDHDRKRVAELHAKGLARNAIAREIGRSMSSVSKIAKELGLPFDRSRTKTATAAKQTDAKARRADLATGALTSADTMQHKALAADSGREARDYAMAYGVFIDRHITLVQHDADNGTSEAKAMLTGLAEALGTAWRNGQPES